MAAYVPSFTYGQIGWDEYMRPQYGLLPWPAHLSPNQAQGIELTKKGQAYVAAVQSEEDAVLVLTFDTCDRDTLAAAVERLIALLDQLDGDPDVELNGDEHDCNLAGATTECETDPAYFDSQGFIWGGGEGGGRAHSGT